MNSVEIKVEGKNLEYASILLNSYAGEVSENSAVHLYFYQHVVASDPVFKKKIEEISIQEMRHLEWLGKTINLLGMNPHFSTINQNNNISYWSGNFVNYTTNIFEMLLADIDSEKTAIYNYRLAKEIIRDKYINNLLDIIIKQEEEHLEFFESYLKKISMR